MPLLVPYWVYGYVKQVEGGIIGDTYVEGATVSVGADSTTTDANGYYQLNIQDVATDGQSSTITATYGVNSDSDSWTVDISDAVKRMDLSWTVYAVGGNPLVKISGEGKRMSIVGKSNRLQIVR